MSRKLTDKQLNKLGSLLKYTDKYDISIQFWVDQTAVFIAKNDVDLTDYGGDFDFAIDSALDYLKRINKKIKPFGV